MGLKLRLLSLYGQRFLRYRPIFIIAKFGHETWPLAKVPEVAHILSFYPRGSKLSRFLLYRQQFLRYGPIFKIAIYEHETWSLEKVPEVAHIYIYIYIYSLSIPRGRNWAYFHSTGSGFRDTGHFSKLPHLGMKYGHWPKFKKLHICSLSTHQFKIELIFALRAALSKILADFYNCHTWAWNLAIG